MENRRILNFEKLLLPLIIIVFGATLRLIPHPANVAPIAAIAIFGGVYLNKKYALVLPILAMIVSDIFLGFSVSTPLVYASFLISGVIGLWLKNHKHLPLVIGATLASSIIFFLLTNFNFWYVTSLYPKTFDGMIQAYFMALPFFRNTVIGDLIYVGLFFASFEVILKLSKEFYGRTNLYKNRG